MSFDPEAKIELGAGNQGVFANEQEKKDFL